MNSVIVDTGYWIALFEEKDPHHDLAEIAFNESGSYRLIIPWPTMYEFMNTRFARRPLNVLKFEKILKKPGNVLLNDRGYREAALDIFFGESNTQRRTMSLVDIVLRNMIADRELQIHSLATFNRADFHDICLRRNIAIIPD